MRWDDSRYRNITTRIINSFYTVHDELGPGFLERVYHKALLIELSKTLKVESEKEFLVEYEKNEVGRYIPDLLVEGSVIIEVKSVKALNDDHKAQLISQLRVSGILIGFLVNFGKEKVEFKRLDNFYQIEKDGLSKEKKKYFSS